MEDGQVQLNYILDNLEDAESVTIAFLIKDKASSISQIFDNAKDMESEITEKYNINFV